MQTDIFGRKSSEISGSEYKPWWQRRGLSSLSSFYSGVSSAGSRIKKSLKLHIHRRNIQSRLQIVNPSQNTEVVFSSLTRPDRRILTTNHIMRSLYSCFEGTMRVISNHEWANKVKSKEADIGFCLHQKVHQINSNRMVKVPHEYIEVIKGIVEDNIRCERIMSHIDRNLSHINPKKDGTIRWNRLIQYSETEDKQLMIPLSLFNYFKKYFILSNANRKSHFNTNAFFEYLESHFDSSETNCNADGHWVPTDYKEGHKEWLKTK